MSKETQFIKEKYDVAVCGGGFAGIAAAMSDDFSTIDLNLLQSELRGRGVVLHECELEAQKKD